MNTEDKEKSTDKQDIDATPIAKRAIRIAVGAVVVMLIAIGAFVMIRTSEPPPKQSNLPIEDRFGVLDMQLLIMAHGDYADVLALKDEIKALEIEVSTEHLNMTFEVPETNHEAFVQASKQKQRMDEINHYARLADEVKAAVKAKREELAIKYDQEVKFAESKYLNEILSIKLELDNSDVMRLTPSEIEERNARISQLQGERDRAVAEIRMAQDAEIKEYAQNLLDDANIRQAEFTDELRAQSAAEELKRETEAQERNAMIMDQGAITPMENAMRIAQKRGELAAKKQQLRVLEQKIFREISGLASKQAIMNNLTMIISSTATSKQGNDFYDYGIGQWHELRTPIIGINTVDLTEIMLQEMRAAGMASPEVSEGEKEK